jgi:hypothetical protein
LAVLVIFVSTRMTLRRLVDIYNIYNRGTCQRPSAGSSRQQQAAVVVGSRSFGLVTLMCMPFT